MQLSRLVRRSWWLAGLAVVAMAVPVTLACVKSRTLVEQVKMAGDDIVTGVVKNFEEVTVFDTNGEETLWTKVTFRVEESYVTGNKDVDMAFYFIGSIIPGRPSTTITPSAEDIRPGRKLLLFLSNGPVVEQVFGAGSKQLYSYAEVYRVEQIKSRRATMDVVIGKGQGFAFPENITLVDARDAIALARK